MTSIYFNNKKLSNKGPLYFIADIAANHDGQLDRALKLIELAKKAGAHAAKFQNFKAPTIVSKKGFENLKGKLSHQNKWKKSVYEVYEDASLNQDWTPILKEKCDKEGIDYFTTPYDFESCDKADSFVDLYKIGSGDITWIEYIEYIASKNKPVLLATGASNIVDVERAMTAISKINHQIILMQCNTNYTGSLDNFKYINLNVLDKYKQQYPNVVLGLSDHTPGHATVLGAIAKGAVVFEKHFTDDINRHGPDHPFSMDPKSWRDMVDRSNELFLSLGDGIKRIEDNEKQSVIVQQRSIRFNKDLKAGNIINKNDLILLRPLEDNGLKPYEINRVIGKKLNKNVAKDELVSLSKIE